MASLNQVQAIGNLGADPEIRTMQGGDRVANLRLACSERWKDRKTVEARERTEWIPVVAFGGVVDVIERYLKKGSRIFVQGKFQTRSWDDQTGQKKYTTEVVIRGASGQLVMLDGRSEGQGGSQPSPPDLDDDIGF